MLEFLSRGATDGSILFGMVNRRRAAGTTQRMLDRLLDELRPLETSTVKDWSSGITCRLAGNANRMYLWAFIGRSYSAAVVDLSSPLPLQIQSMFGWSSGTCRCSYRTFSDHTTHKAHFVLRFVHTDIELGRKKTRTESFAQGGKWRDLRIRGLPFWE